MLKKIVSLGLLVAFALFALNQIRASLRSPSERLLWRVETMVEDFNQGHIRPLMTGFDEDFRDESSGALKSQVHSALAGLVLAERNRGANAFALHADWVTPFVPVLTEDETKASAEVHLRITHTSRGRSRLWWEAKAILEFVYLEGKWRLKRSRSVNHRERI